MDAGRPRCLLLWWALAHRLCLRTRRQTRCLEVVRVLVLVCGLRWGPARKERCRRDLSCHEQQRVSVSNLLRETWTRTFTDVGSCVNCRRQGRRRRLWSAQRVAVKDLLISRWYGRTGDGMRETAYFGADLRGARCAGVVPFGMTFF